MNTTTLVKWGNSQGIRLPKNIISKAGLNIGENLNISIDSNKSIVLTPVRTETITIPDFASMFEHYHGPHPKEDGLASPRGKERL